MLPATTLHRRSTPRTHDMQKKSTTGAWVLIVLGTYFLLSKHGWMPNIGPLISAWWPAILIIIGVSMLVRRSAVSCSASYLAVLSEQCRKRHAKALRAGNGQPLASAATPAWPFRHAPCGDRTSPRLNS